ncbi:MAG TPA: putative porin, partial [Bacteroidia bacterium]
SILANGIISSIKSDENGGLVNDQIFENNLFVNKQLFAVEIPNARTRRNSRSFCVRQSWNFGRKDTVKVNDSTKFVRIQPVTSISFSTRACQSWFVYDDKNPTIGYYKNVFFDTLRSLDSTHTTIIENELSFNRLLHRKKKAEIEEEAPPVLSLSVKDQLVHVKEFEGDSAKYRLVDSTLHNLFASGMFRKSFLTIAGNYCFNGPNKSDFNTLAKITLRLSRRSVFEIEGNVTQAGPNFLYNRYSSNNFIWKNNFDQTLVEKGAAAFSNSRYKFMLSGEYYNVTNYIYLNEESKPVRSVNPVAIYAVCMQKNFRLGKINLNNKITWHQAPEEVIHLPQLMTDHSLFYQDKWFKKVLDVQIGFDVLFYTSYYADAYIPALGLYHLQNETMIGNYPYVDFFFNMKVKHIRFFFKTEHVNSGLMGPYYMAPHMPAPDRSVKVGISWLFFD